MTTDYDVCVIGGGIQGCGVAQAAAAAGYKVVLLEKTGLASATSSRSSKLIHGGLRYLESAQFSLVAESLYERELLIKNAPDLVKRRPFYIPVYKQSTRSVFKVYTGLSLYSILGRLKATASFRKLDPQKWSDLDGLRLNDLKAVFEYYDAQTDDKKLTQAVMYSACELGAEFLCPATFLSAKLIQAVSQPCYEIAYEHDGQQKSLTSKTLVNASGPWVNKVQQLITPQIATPAVELVQGAHIVIKQSAPHGVYYVESPQDCRAVFIMPWYGQTMIGTTETAFDGQPEQVTPTEHECDYLSGIMQYYFPGAKMEIVDSFAGLRVLPASSTKSMFNRSRDTIYLSDPAFPGYVAMMGGKLTGYRAAAQTALGHINHNLPDAEIIIDTKDVKLSEKNFDS